MASDDGKTPAAFQRRMRRADHAAGVTALDANGSDFFRRLARVAELGQAHFHLVHHREIKPTDLKLRESLADFRARRRYPSENERHQFGTARTLRPAPG
jgi:hypothetical protein